jgi:hypothetical protein
MTQWTYTLTLQEEGQCCEVGYERQKPYFGDPTHNRNYFEGDRWELFQHIQCAEAELAAARMLGLNNFIPHFNEWKNKLDIPGNPGFEVRYVRDKGNWSFPSLRYSTKADNRGIDIPYILITGGPEERSKRDPDDGYIGRPYKAEGWSYASEIAIPQYQSVWADQSHVYEIPYYNLRSMDELLPIKEYNLANFQ